MSKHEAICGSRPVRLASTRIRADFPRDGFRDEDFGEKGLEQVQALEQPQGNQGACVAEPMSPFSLLGAGFTDPEISPTDCQECRDRPTGEISGLGYSGRVTCTYCTRENSFAGA